MGGRGEAYMGIEMLIRRRDEHILFFTLTALLTSPTFGINHPVGWPGLPDSVLKKRGAPNYHVVRNPI